MTDIGPSITLYEALQGNKITDDGLLHEAVESLRRHEISSHLVRALIRRVQELENTNAEIRKLIPNQKQDKHRKSRKLRIQALDELTRMGQEQGEYK